MKLNIQKQSLPTVESAYAAIIGQNQENHIVPLSVDQIDEIEKQPYKIHEDKIDRIAESMKIVGQLEAVLVVPSKQSGRYTLLAGRHRLRAAVKLGNTTVDAIIKHESDTDRQRLMLLATNNDRNNDYLPSEKAFAYKEQAEILQRQGRATNTIIAQQNGINTKEVQRYIRLTKLIKPLRDRVDSKVIPFIAAVDLSYLDDKQQKHLFEFLLNHPEAKITTSIAKEIKEHPDALEDIFSQKIKEYDYKETNANIEPPERINNSMAKPIKEENAATTVDKLSTSSVLSANEENNKIDDNLAVVLSFVLLDKSLINLIITKFYSTNEVLEYINKHYVLTHMHKKEFITEKCPVQNYKTLEYTFDKKLIFTVNDTQYSLSYKKLDFYFRDYIRKYISTETIINLFNASKSLKVDNLSTKGAQE